MMPVMDGWTFLNVRQSDPHLATIPVVIMSAVEPARLRNVPAEHHLLRKPFSVDDLLEAVEESAA
jgi:CheY-like chemotaxis protein